MLVKAKVDGEYLGPRTAGDIFEFKGVSTSWWMVETTGEEEAHAEPVDPRSVGGPPPSARVGARRGRRPIMAPRDPEEGDE